MSILFYDTKASHKYCLLHSFALFFFFLFFYYVTLYDENVKCQNEGKNYEKFWIFFFSYSTFLQFFICYFWLTHTITKFIRLTNWQSYFSIVLLILYLTQVFFSFSYKREVNKTSKDNFKRQQIFHIYLMVRRENKMSYSKSIVVAFYIRHNHAWLYH